MNGQMDLDVRLERWFAAEAPLRAPDRVLAVTMDRVDRTGQRRSRSRWRVSRTTWRDLTPSRPALLIAIGVLALLAAGVVAAAFLRVPPRTGADLIVVRRLLADQPDSGFEAIAVSADGQERSLARWTRDALEAPWDGSSALVASSGLMAVRTDDAPDGATAVLDLRSSDVSPRYPDSNGYPLGSWDADGTRMAESKDDGITIHDLRTGGATTVRLPTGAFLVPGTDAPTWAADGGGFIVADGMVTAEAGVPGLVRPAPPGILRLDGSYEAGPVAALDDGIGPRRLRADGSFLACGPQSTSQCTGDGSTLWSDGRRYQAVWTDRDPLTQVGDFAWAVDGGLWLITETVAPGPRDVELVHVDRAGSRRSIVALRAGADDPDPSGHCPGGSFVAMAPDDTRLVIGTSADGCTSGPTYLIDVKTGLATPLDGVVAGWLPPGALDQSRPGLAPAADLPVAVRGDWGRIAGHPAIATPPDAVRLHLGRTTAELRWAAGASLSMSVARSGDDRLVVTAFTPGLGCPVGASSTYAWAVADDRLELRAVDDPCPQRAALLASTFDPTLELAGNWEPRAVAGRTYLVPEIGLRFTVATDQDTWIWSRSEKAVELGSDHDGWFSLSWPTDPPAADLRGLDAGVAFIDSLAASGIEVVDRTTTTVDGRPAITGRIQRTSDPGLGAEIWPPNDGGPGFNVLDGTQLTLLTDPAERLYTIVVRGADDPTVAAWAKALTDSLRWDGD